MELMVNLPKDAKLDHPPHLPKASLCKSPAIKIPVTWELVKIIHIQVLIGAPESLLSIYLTFLQAPVLSEIHHLQAARRIAEVEEELAAAEVGG